MNTEGVMRKTRDLRFIPILQNKKIAFSSKIFLPAPFNKLTYAQDKNDRCNDKKQESFTKESPPKNETVHFYL